MSILYVVKDLRSFLLPKRHLIINVASHKIFAVHLYKKSLYS